MPLIKYQAFRFSPSTAAVISQANKILAEYAAQGFDLTLRQLYYQFVARGFIENKNSEYKRLGSIVNDARLAGLIDWDRITDRTRNMQQNPHWNTPKEIIAACAQQFQIDKWQTQKNYVEVWVEKDALIGVLEVACRPLDCPYFSCRGYTSQSEMWSASQRLLDKLRAGKSVHVIHLGDHDPSGVDMSRDIEERLSLFMRHGVLRDLINANPPPKLATPADKEAARERFTNLAEFHPPYIKPVSIHRIALNMDQIKEHNPPANPAKFTDSRAAEYVSNFGGQSWELDALEPAVITGLIQETIAELRDEALWEQATRKEAAHRRKLAACAEKWGEIEKTL
jgi:hypothetical protein